MINYNISLNQELASIVKTEMKRGKYANRSEFFRDLIRKVFIEEKQNNYEDNQDWIYQAPFAKELENRLDAVKKGKEKLISSTDFDQEFGFNE